MVERYRPRTPPVSPEPLKRERRNRQKGDRRKARRELVGEPTKKRGRGRPPGSKDTARLKLDRIQKAYAKKNILPHEFLLMVINTGLTGGTLGFYVNAKGEKIPNVVTFDQMVTAAMHGLRYFAAPVRVEHTGAGGGPIEVFHIPQDRLGNLGTEELRFLQTVLPKLGGTVKQIEHDPNEGDADAYEREIGMVTDEAA
jgi:hypothetical protein